MNDIINQQECQEEKRGYYAVIPAQVRYDKSLPDKAKLLYGEISALVNAEGFCFASNDYFARLYGCTIGTIARQMGQLEKAGYILRELEKDQTGQVVRRKIMLAVSTSDAHPHINFDNTPYHFCREGGIKNDKDNISIINNKKENKKEKTGSKKTTPSEEDFQPMPLFEDWIRLNFSDSESQLKNELYLALKRFMENRVTIKKPMKSKAAVTALCNRLARLTHADLEQMVELLDTATVNGWQSVYAGKDAPKAKGAPDGKEDEGRYVPL